jgi:Flp pilus assembly protein TadG
VFRLRRAASGAEGGQAVVEAAVAFPVLLMMALALVQFALYAHAAHVVAAAAQEGARVAAAEDGALEEGVAQAQALLRAGLGPTADGVSLRAAEDGQAVSLAVTGQLRLVIPWSADASLPLSARAVVAKERFRAGGA